MSRRSGFGVRVDSIGVFVESRGGSRGSSRVRSSGSWVFCFIVMVVLFGNFFFVGFFGKSVGLGLSKGFVFFDCGVDMFLFNVLMLMCSSVGVERRLCEGGGSEECE